MSTGLVHNRLILPLLVAVMICSSVQAQGPAAAPAPVPESGGYLSPFASVAPAPFSTGLDCTNQLLNLSSCLTYVEEGSNLTVPDKGCCPSFSSLVDNSPLCLCQLLANSNSFGIQIDETKALKLPASCHVETLPVSLCTALGIPVASPMGLSPSPSSLAPLEPGILAPVIAPSSMTSTASMSSKATSTVIVAGSLFIAAIF